MTWPVRIGGLVVLAAGLLLGACAPLPVRTAGTPEQLAAQAARERVLEARQDWNLHARFAASDGRNGGSGSLDWNQTGDRYVFVLRAPITGKTVRLEGGPDGAVLSGLDKTPLQGRDAESVLSEQFGWHVPVAQLAYWVRGLRAPGAPARLTFGADGLPATLDQDGWRIEYRDWYADRTPPMPRKVFASRDPYSVRVLIEQWQDSAVRQSGSRTASFIQASELTRNAPAATISGFLWGGRRGRLHQGAAGCRNNARSRHRDVPHAKAR